MKVKLAHAIPTGAPTILDEIIDTALLVALKQLKSCLYNKKF